MTEDRQNKVNKVAPYPIEGHLIKVEGQPAVIVSILKLTEVGFLCKVKGHHFKVGENLSMKFVLPVLQKVFNESVKVVKTYESLDHYVRGGKTEKLLTLELHFLSLSGDKATVLKDFVNRTQPQGHDQKD